MQLNIYNVLSNNTKIINIPNSFVSILYYNIHLERYKLYSCFKEYK